MVTGGAKRELELRGSMQVLLPCIYMNKLKMGKVVKSMIKRKKERKEEELKKKEEKKTEK